MKPVKIMGMDGMPDSLLGYAVRKEDGELLRALNIGLNRLRSSLYWRVNKIRYFNRDVPAKRNNPVYRPRGFAFR